MTILYDPKEVIEACGFSKIVIDEMVRLEQTLGISPSIRMGQFMRTLIDGIDLHTKPMTLKTKTTGHPPWVSGYIMWDQSTYGREESSPIPKGGPEDKSHWCPYTQNGDWASLKTNLQLSTKKFLFSLAENDLIIQEVKPPKEGESTYTILFKNTPIEQKKGYSKENIDKINNQIYSIEIPLDESLSTKSKIKRSDVIGTRPHLEYHKKLKEKLAQSQSSTKEFLSQHFSSKNPLNEKLITTLAKWVDESPLASQYNRVDDLLPVTYFDGSKKTFEPLTMLPVTGDMDLLCTRIIIKPGDNLNLLEKLNMSVYEDKQTMLNEVEKRSKRDPFNIYRSQASKTIRENKSPSVESKEESLRLAINSINSEEKKTMNQIDKTYELTGVGHIGDFLSAYFINANNDARIEDIKQFFHHGSEVYNPGKQSDIDEPSFHIIKGIPVVTETEAELIFLLIKTTIPGSFFTPINPQWVTKENSQWHLLVEKQIEIGDCEKIIFNRPELLTAFIETVIQRNIAISDQCKDNIEATIDRINPLLFQHTLTNKKHIKEHVKSLKAILKSNLRSLEQKSIPLLRYLKTIGTDSKNPAIVRIKKIKQQLEVLEKFNPILYDTVPLTDEQKKLLKKQNIKFDGDSVKITPFNIKSLERAGLNCKALLSIPIDFDEKEQALLEDMGFNQSFLSDGSVSIKTHESLQKNSLDQIKTHVYTPSSDKKTKLLFKNDKDHEKAAQSITDLQEAVIEKKRGSFSEESRPISNPPLKPITIRTEEKQGPGRWKRFVRKNIFLSTHPAKPSTPKRSGITLSTVEEALEPKNPTKTNKSS
ncbi:MAG TPA: hypothetical protein QF353_04230 [Gammaproteobacteria bacterium]|nr:hypothetical protein [Gammaproteobacteria bacterium]